MAGLDLSQYGTAVPTSPDPANGARGLDLSQYGVAAKAPPQPSAPTPGFFGPAIDTLKNFGTGVENALGGLIGTPRAMAPTINSFGTNPNSRMERGLASLMPGKPLLPTTEETTDFIKGNTGLDYVPSTAGGRIFQQATTGAGMGAAGGGPGAFLGGVGAAADQTAKELGLPEWAQAAAGIVTPLLLHGGVSGTRALLRPTTRAGQMGTAQKILDEAAINKDAPIGQPPVAGAPSTLGQATNDPGLLALEKGRFASSPQMAGKFTEIKQGANEATTNSLQGAVTMPNRGGAVQQMQDASTGMHQAVSDSLAQFKGAVDRMWGRVDPNNQTALDTGPLKQAVDSYVGGLSKVRQGFVPSDVHQMIQSLAPQVPLRELQDLRSAVTTQARSLRDSGKYNEANAVQGMAGTVGQHVDNLTMPNVALSQDYADARSASRNFHETYDADPIQRGLNGDPSKAGAQFMRTPEGFDAYYKATGGAPQAMQHARDYFSGGLAKAAESTGAENQTLLASPFNRYLRDNQFLINDRRLFTTDQAQVIQRAADQLDYTLRTQRAGMAGTSPTYQLLSTEKFAEGLVGKKGAAVAKFINKGKTIAGGVAGHHFGGGAGMVIGAALGHASGVPYEAAASKVLGIVDRAVSDPQFASELRRYRDNPSPKTMTPSIKNLLAPIRYPTPTTIKQP